MGQVSITGGRGSGCRPPRSFRVPASRTEPRVVVVMDNKPAFRLQDLSRSRIEDSDNFLPGEVYRRVPPGRCLRR